VNGAQMAASSAGVRGMVLLRLEGRGESLSAPLGVTGPATYAFRAYPGRYDVVFDNGACADGGSAVPCQKKSIRTVEVTSSGGLDVDLKVARVSGRVTANGQAVRASTGAERGRIVFTESEGSAVSAGIGATSDALYSRSVLHGTYAVSFANATDCPRGVLPCQSLPLREGIAVNGNASLDLDLKVVQVGGAVKVNGAEMPASVSGAARGALDLLTGLSASVRAGLGTTGPAVYSAQVFSGAYGVRFDGTDCPATGDGAVPCQDAQLLGCPR
jgi:hypothetical protein